MKHIATFILVSLPLASFGAENNDIPFITNSYSDSVSEPGYYSYRRSPPVVSGQDTGSIVNKIGSEKIASTIRDVKTSVCSGVDDGSVKVYFTLDAAGMVFGIGASAGAGIEVTFNCENDKSP